ncbi:alpha/beta hydrolase family protein [Mycolicibacterium arenosum]|uniref:PE-PPE domain-containing protein n=1 Tax=Mycolicibacterium arenosum TaxID=2952157 RepID=A0ABT1LZ86_9MYCO|nr:PE-PPE domain-containing protein [Mycolicibacterium sp. CAU 1645]MCP9272196.1 PE-PPE domain-containing protein [Mycolicibacterium sp. CAU 1645]
MAGDHQLQRDRTRVSVGFRPGKLAVAAVAIMTAATLTVGLVPPPTDEMLNRDVALAAAVKTAPPPDEIPDLTGGLGTAGYDLAQQIAAAILEAIMNNINLMALAKASGMDPASFLQGLSPELLRGVLDRIPIDLSPLLANLVGLDAANGILGPALKALGITDGTGMTTVTKLLQLLGLDLSDPLNLSNLDVPGLNIITTGPPFTLLKLLGLDLGWVPALPNSVAAEVNSTEYLPLGVNGLLSTVLDRLQILSADNPLLGLGGLVGSLDGLLDNVVDAIPARLDLIDLRVPIVVGFGLGAFAAGAAYPKIVEDLQYQPGGAKSPTKATDPLLGSLTILPMLLLRNPGRANGGLFARFYPIARLFGIDTVTPDTQVTSSGGVPIGTTGLSLGGANLIPIKVDATVQYDLLSDFAAWPNPFSVANNLMAFLLPTYVLRGVDTSNLTPQMEAQLKQILSSLGADPLALNLYLTLPANSLPLLEPLYLLTDLTNIMTLGAFPNPLGTLANALAPALTSLVNLGYTDVVRNPDGTYTRTLDQAGDPTAFMSFPDVDWGRVPGDIVQSLINGIQKEFFSGNPTPSTPNAITGVFTLLSKILGGGGIGFGGFDDIIKAVVGGMNPLAAAATKEVGALPEAKPAPMTTTFNEPTYTNVAPAKQESVPEPEAVEETEPEPTKETRTSSVPRPAGMSATPRAPGSPVGSVVGGVTDAVGGITGGVTNTVGGVTGGVTNTVGGVTGGVTDAVGGVTGGLTGGLKKVTGGLGLG